MAHTLPILVFSDLDGTLIDHDTYRWNAARPALEALNRLGAGIVLASSKTGAEISVIKEEMGLTSWPAIVENGAGVIHPDSLVPEDNKQYQSIRHSLDELPELVRRPFRGFGDMDVPELVELTGLTSVNAALSKQRNYSEPGLWSGTDAQLSEFLAALSRHNISARSGGRFLTLSYGQNKADRMLEVIEQYKPRYTVALGDAPNDVEMLQSADIGVIVANPAGEPMQELEYNPNRQIIRTKLTGPSGWNRAILDIVANLELD